MQVMRSRELTVTTCKGDERRGEERRGAYRVLVGIVEGKRPLGRNTGRWGR
jgi:hypothetical protein